MMWISMSLAWTPARSRSRSPHIALKVFCWSLLVAMIYNRSPSRVLGPFPVPFFRSVPLLTVPFLVPFRLSCLPVLRVGWLGVGRDGRGAGRGSGRLLAWAARACSLVSWSVYLFHCISFRCGFRCPDGCFRALTAACFVFVLVPFCAFPSVLVHPRLAAAVRLAGPFLVPLVSSVWRRGGGRLLACPCSSGLRGG